MPAPFGEAPADAPPLEQQLRRHGGVMSAVWDSVGITTASDLSCLVLIDNGHQLRVGHVIHVPAELPVFSSSGTARPIFCFDVLETRREPNMPGRFPLRPAFGTGVPFGLGVFGLGVFGLGVFGLGFRNWLGSAFRREHGTPA
jgi:hypothetical protein